MCVQECVCVRARLEEGGCKQVNQRKKRDAGCWERDTGTHEGWGQVRGWVGGCRGVGVDGWREGERE